MHSRTEYFFTLRDLDTTLRLNPYLRAIGGHSVVPHGDLARGLDNLDFITQLRDPVARAASHYKYWVNKLKLDEDWQSFLKHPVSHNFQVKKLAGCEDLDLAKETIANHFLLAGTVSQFDAFLVLLANKLRVPLELLTYTKRNVDSIGQHLEIPQSFFDQLREQNQLDQQLYDWVHAELFSHYVEQHTGDFSFALEQFRTLQQQTPIRRMQPVIDSIYRNGYLKPTSGLIRIVNGLPYHGSYATE